MQSGKCRLCGKIRPLSKEHVPPEAAFNEAKVLFHRMRFNEPEVERFAEEKTTGAFSMASSRSASGSERTWRQSCLRPRFRLDSAISLESPNTKFSRTLLMTLGMIKPIQLRSCCS